MNPNSSPPGSRGASANCSRQIKSSQKFHLQEVPASQLLTYSTQSITDIASRILSHQFPQTVEQNHEEVPSNGRIKSSRKFPQTVERNHQTSSLKRSNDITKHFIHHSWSQKSAINQLHTCKSNCREPNITSCCLQQLAQFPVKSRVQWLHPPPSDIFLVQQQTLNPLFWPKVVRPKTFSAFQESTP